MRFSTSSIVSISSAVATVNGALTSVTNFGNNPTNLQMNIYVPANVAPKPAIIVALHGCYGSGPAYYAQTQYGALSEQKGYLTIFPSATHDSNCWEVNTAKGLSRNAGGDNQGVISMVNWAISQFSADPTKVFVTGSSSGCMMTNVLMATYPDVFSAATCYSGAAAGCSAGSPGASPISSDGKCAGGQIIKTQAEWVSVAQAMFPGYNGPYPRLSTWHGTADGLVNLVNLDEQLLQWSGLLGVSFTGNLTNTPQQGYTEMVYGDGTKLRGYEAQGVGHTVPVHETEDLAWFGL